MPTNEELKNYLDGLTPEEKKVAKDYLSSLQVTQEVKKEELATNLSSESKEAVSKSLEFEGETFKIDSSTWKEETRTVNGSAAVVKVSPAGDVIEYIDGPAKGEQLFINYNSFIKYVAEAKGCTVQEAEQKYLLTKQELQMKMKQVHYTEFYNTQIKGHLAGYWDPSSKECYDVGVRSNVWLAGGHFAEFDQDIWDYGSNCASFGFSGRLLKN